MARYIRKPLTEIAMFKAVAIAALFAALLPAAPAFAINSPDYLVAQCQSALDGMNHIVRKQAVQAIKSGARVSVVPFCIGIGPIDFGNAAGLTKVIGDNPVLAAALRRSGWRSDDVTSIRINGNSVTLYVHTE